MEIQEYISNGLCHSLHTSERRSFRSCRRRWHWSSIDMYYPLVTPQPLEFGVAYHAAMEEFYRPEFWFQDREVQKYVAMQRFKQVCQQQLKKYERLNGQPEVDVLNDYKERVQLGLNMFKYYAEQISPQFDKGFRPVEVEVAFEVPILSPQGQAIWCTCARCRKKYIAGASILHDHLYDWDSWQGLPVTYGGRIDMLAQDEIGRYFVVDWKTCSRLLDEGKEESFLELDDQISCVPMETEILTPSGWKTRFDLEVGDIVLAYDSVTKTNKWTQILALHDYTNATLFEIHDKSKSFSSTTTYDHKWFGERPSSYGKYAKIVDWQPTTETIDNYTSKSAIIVSAPSEVDGCSPITPDEAALIGWIITDGPIHIRENQYIASITQAVHKYADEIQSLIDRVGIYHSFKTINDSKLSNKPYKKWVFSQPEIEYLWIKAGLENRLDNLDEFVLNLSSKARSSFIDAGLKAEGTFRKNGIIQFCQNDGIIKEAFRLALFLEGKRTSRGTTRNFSIRKGRPVADIRTLSVDELPGKHDVWCMSTKYGSFVMRQGRQITITGNSYCFALQTHYNIPIAGFVYVEIKKVYPEPPEELTRLYKGRKYSTNKQFLTTEQIFRNTVKEHDPLAYAAGLYDIHLEWLKQDGPKFHQRHQIHKNEHELREIGNNIYLEALDIISNPRIYPQPGRFSCPSCLYRQPCLGKNQGEHYEYTLETMFEKRTHHYYEDKAPSTE